MGPPAELIGRQVIQFTVVTAIARFVGIIHVHTFNLGAAVFTSADADRTEGQNAGPVLRSIRAANAPPLSGCVSFVRLFRPERCREARVGDRAGRRSRTAAYEAETEAERVRAVERLVDEAKKQVAVHAGGLDPAHGKIPRRRGLPVRGRIFATVSHGPIVSQAGPRRHHMNMWFESEC